MGKRRLTVSVPGHPQLEGVLQTIADYAATAPGILAGHGLRKSTVADGILLEWVPPGMESRSFWPFVFHDGSSYKVGLTPGDVTWGRGRASGVTSTKAGDIKRMPFIDDGGDVPLDDSPPPGVSLTGGSYYVAWLLVTKEEAEVVFEEDGTDPTSPANGYAVMLCRFKVQELSGGKQDVCDVTVYAESHRADSFEDDCGFRASIISATQVRVGSGKVVTADWSGSITMSDPEPVAVAKEVSCSAATATVANGSKIYCKLTYTKATASEGTGTFTAFYVSAAEIHVASSTPTGTATIGYVLLAEVVTDTDRGGLSVIQRHRGAITAPSVTGYADPVAAAGGESDKWFRVSPEVVSNTVEVNPGRVYRTQEYGFTSVLGYVTSCMTADSVAGDTVSLVTTPSIPDTQYIVLRVNYELGSDPSDGDYLFFPFDENGANDPGVDVGGIVEGDVGGTPTDMRGTVGRVEWVTPSSYELLATTSPVEASSALGIDIILAEVIYDSGTWSILQRTDGAVYLFPPYRPSGLSWD